METNQSLPQLYLAAPLFSNAEKAYNTHLKEILVPYFEVHLPQEDGPLMLDLVQRGTPVESAINTVFRSDLAAIDTCEIVLIVLDGRTVDEGAAFELGYGFSRQKTCVGLQTDFRTMAPFGNNPMISGALEKLFRDEQELARWSATYSNQSRLTSYAVT